MDRINLRTVLSLQAVLGISRIREKPHILKLCFFCGGTFVAFSYEIKGFRVGKRRKKAMKNSINQERVSKRIEKK